MFYLFQRVPRERKLAHHCLHVFFVNAERFGGRGHLRAHGRRCGRRVRRFVNRDVDSWIRIYNSLPCDVVTHFQFSILMWQRKSQVNNSHFEMNCQCRPSPGAAAHCLVHEREEEDQNHGGDVLKGNHAQVVEYAGNEPLQVRIGDLARLRFQLRDSIQGVEL